MSWLITPNQKLDPDAAIYIDRVQAADGQSLETPVQSALNTFVVGCKADGTWNAIKASCILAGARTLAGALVPLVGAAPTNPANVFVQADYSRKSGLIGNGSTKYLISNFLDNGVGQNNISLSCYQSSARTATATEGLIGVITTTPSFSATVLQATSGGLVAGYSRAPSDNNPFGGSITSAKFIGVSRSTSGSYVLRDNSNNTTFSQTSASSVGINFYVFARNNNNALSIPTNARLAFYSIGESLDLALLDTRVTALINALTAAIP